MRIGRININWQKQEKATASYITQVSREPFTPFDADFNAYQPFKKNIKLYQTLRESIPLLGAAIQRKKLLVGGFDIDAEGKESVQKTLDEFKRDVKVNDFQKGLNSFLNENIDNTFLTGMGWGEIVMNRDASIYSLRTLPTEYMGFVREGQERFFGYLTGVGVMKKIENQELITYLTFETRDGKPEGISLLESMPFTAQIYIRMQKSWDNYVMRVGDPTFMIYVKGGEGQKADSVSKISSAIANRLRSLWKDRKSGKVGDVYGGVPYGGDVVVKVLGADAELPDISIPYNDIKEQLISKTGLTPPLLGFSQQHGNYRVTKDQNDLIVGNVKAERDRIQPIVEKILDLFLISQNMAGSKYRLRWHPVNLLDEKEQANAAYFEARANQQKLESLAFAIERGYISEEQVEEMLAEIGYKGLKEDFWNEAYRKRLAKFTYEDIFKE